MDNKSFTSLPGENRFSLVTVTDLLFLSAVVYLKKTLSQLLSGSKVSSDTIF